MVLKKLFNVFLIYQWNRLYKIASEKENFNEAEKLKRLLDKAIRKSEELQKNLEMKLTKNKKDDR